MAHEFSLRVYYEDTDAGGVVYYANYLKFAERARTEALRAVGINQSKLLQEECLAFVVRSCNAEYISPAKLDDCLTIKTRLQDIMKASLMLQQTIEGGQNARVELAVRLAVVNAQFRPVRIPPALQEMLARAYA